MNLRDRELENLAVRMISQKFPLKSYNEFEGIAEFAVGEEIIAKDLTLILHDVLFMDREEGFSLINLDLELLYGTPEENELKIKKRYKESVRESIKILESIGKLLREKKEITILDLQKAIAQTIKSNNMPLIFKVFEEDRPTEWLSCEDFKLGGEKDEQ